MKVELITPLAKPYFQLQKAAVPLRSATSTTMAAISAARAALRSAATTSRTAARLASGAKTTPRSPFRISMQKPLTARIFRSPVEMSSVSVQSMLPYHSATASALLTSMLSVSPRSYGWTLEGL